MALFDITDTHDFGLQETAMEQRELSSLSRSMITSLVGKQQCKLMDLEKQLKASTSVDYKREVVTLWALPKDMGAAVQQIEDMCEALRFVLSMFVQHPRACVFASQAFADTAKICLRHFAPLTEPGLALA